MSFDDDMTLYHHLQQIYVLLDDGDRRTLRDVDLTPTQYTLLLKLDTERTEGMTITALSQVLLCTRGNATRLVQRLAAQGLVACAGDGRDQRLVRVSLTQAGKTKLDRARVLHHAAVQRRFAALPAETRAVFDRLTADLVSTLTADLAAQPERAPLPDDA